MATVKTDERNYMNIANAIRAKTGSSDTFTPGEMDAAILSIPAGSSGSGLTEEVKQALLDCFENVAWINDQGQTYYQALYDALYPPANLVSISALFTQGSAVIYDTDSLDSLKQYLVVTALYDDSTTETLEDTDYTLSGNLAEGTSVITVSYGGKTTTFNVTVTHNTLLLNDILTLDGIENTRNGHNASSTTWEDLSGNNHDFAKYGTDVLWNDKAGIFNGSSTGLSNSGVLLPTTLTEFTIEVSVKIGNIGTSENGYPILRCNTDAWNQRDCVMAIIQNSEKRVEAAFGIGTTVVVGDAIAHVTFVFTGGKIKKFVNGELRTTTSSSYSTASLGRNVHYIGTDNNKSNYFTGEIYRIGISSTALSDEEIASRYNKLQARFG